MIVIGVTGNLSSGKSAVAKILKSLGAKVLDADIMAKNAVRKGRPAYKGIVKLFGKEYLQKSGQINRKKLATRVFSRPKDLEKLNILIHPEVIFEAFGAIEKEKSRKGYLVMDVPLLFEAKMEALADFTILVTSKPSALIARSRKKGISPKLAKRIIASQWSVRKKEKLVDYVVKNDGTPADLKKKIMDIIQDIENKQGER